MSSVKATLMRVLRQIMGITRLESKSEVVTVYDMRGYDTVEIQFHSFSTSALNRGVGGQQHTPVALPTAKEVSVTNV